uniref:Uncharacterized protein n=1 Tax=Acrobeloides nanus TaxID=290746 RepID=A0A914DMZ0_9BILA
MLGHIYKSSGTFDEVGFQNLYNAYTAGNYEGIDSFISPCVSGNCANGLNSGKDQANAILERITQIEQFHPFPWISVSRADGWSADPETNAAFLKDMIETIWVYEANVLPGRGICHYPIPKIDTKNDTFWHFCQQL